MSKVSLRFFLLFFNTFGILSIRKNKNHLKTSNFLTLINIFKLPLVIVFSYFVLTNIPLRQFIYKDDVIFRNRYYSAFTKFLILVTGRIVHISTLATCLVNFHRRGKILNLIRRIYKMELSAEYALQLKLYWTRLFFILSFLILVVKITAFTSKMNISVLSLICHIITSIPYHIISGYLVLIKAFEIFFILALKDFRETLNVVLKRSNLNMKDYKLLAVTYRDICEMNKYFGKAFGTQITIIVICVIAVLIFQVPTNFHYHKFTIIYFYIFSSFKQYKAFIK